MYEVLVYYNVGRPSCFKQKDWDACKRLVNILSFSNRAKRYITGYQVRDQDAKLIEAGGRVDAS